MCPFKLLTGWDCPGCGALRAVNDLGNGHVDAALHSNAVLVLSLPLLVLGWIAWTMHTARRGPVAVRPRAVSLASTAYVLVVLGFAIYRNTPWGIAWRVA